MDPSFNPHNHRRREDSTLDDLLLDYHCHASPSHLKELLTTLYQSPLLVATNEGALSEYRIDELKAPGYLVASSQRAIQPENLERLIDLFPRPAEFRLLPGSQLFERVLEQDNEKFQLHLVGPKGVKKSVSKAVVSIFVENLIRESAQEILGPPPSADDNTLLVVPSLDLHTPWEICGHPSAKHMTLDDWINASDFNEAWLPGLVECLLHGKHNMSTLPYPVSPDLAERFNLFPGQIYMVFADPKTMYDCPLIACAGSSPDIDLVSGSKIIDLLARNYTRQETGEIKQDYPSGGIEVLLSQAEGEQAPPIETYLGLIGSDKIQFRTASSIMKGLGVFVDSAGEAQWYAPALKL